MLSCWVESVQAQMEQRERWLHTPVEAEIDLVKKQKEKNKQTSSGCDQDQSERHYLKFKFYCHVQS